MNLNEFTEKLGSTTPTPGGGAAAGLSLSLGAACAEKAARFSLSDEILHILEKLVEIRLWGDKLCEADQIAFIEWQKTKKLPKETEDEKKIRKEAIDNAALECAKIPLLTAEYAVKLLYTIDEFLPYCNKFLISDAACGVSFASAAFESSVFNIMINMPYVKNEIFKNQLETFLSGNQPHFDVIKGRILAECYKKLGQ